MWLTLYMQITTERPSFTDVMDTVMDIVLQSSSSSECVRSLVEGLLSHFFSKYRTGFPKEDCWSFLLLANKQTGFTTVPVAESTERKCDYLCSCTSMNVFKVYLTRILDKGSSGTRLGLYDPKVMIKLILV